MGREVTERSDAVKFVIDRVIEQAKTSLQDINNDPVALWGTLEKSILEANNQMRVIAKHRH